ncbi:hypothetical protein Mtc_1224 [Methanocella conradii HZ254]|uniref:Uncharacterized protein n=1 Tax=Methanocella conradii (strain DSM 24694 / JCM 17849 / CGMCC 1.5162 / HZ254) TaxID=1041930 RepID=H8I8S3_METCZ|nr:hypothetical protein [Methanocella conradii]AFC99977.1 hypothetical protein Mtc_1224 [Methanocella conradii HZ254]
MVKDYLMRSRTGGSLVVKMHFQYDPGNEYKLYVSNLEDVNIEAHYPYRWNIESCLAKNMVDAVTSSTSMAYQILLKTISLILANLWKLLVKTMLVYTTMKTTTMKTFKRMLGSLILEDETWNRAKERG